MMDNTKEFIIKNIRNALIDVNQVPTPRANPNETYFRLTHSEDIVVNFVNAFMLMGGTIQYCTGNSDVERHLATWINSNKIFDLRCSTNSFINYLQKLNLPVKNISILQDKKSYKDGIVLCDNLLSWNGSIVVTNECFETKKYINMPQNTVLVAFTSQVLLDWKTYISEKRENGGIPDEIYVLKNNSLITKKIQLLLIEDQN